MDDEIKVKGRRATGSTWCVYVSDRDLRDRIGERAQRRLGAPSLSAAIRMALRRVVEGDAPTGAGVGRPLSVSEDALAELLERQVELNQMTVQLLKSVVEASTAA